MMPDLDLLPMEDCRLEHFGREYRRRCYLQGGNDVLLSGRRIITFEQFLVARNLSEDFIINMHRRREMGI